MSREAPGFSPGKEGMAGARTAAVGVVRSGGILHVAQKTDFKRDPEGGNKQEGRKADVRQAASTG